MPERTSVFVSGTYHDMRREREAVRLVLSHLQVACVSMEFFGAHSWPPLETCLSRLRRVDLVLLLVGHRYGSRCDENGVSYTEMEYTEAVEQDLPVLVYMRRDDVPVLPEYVDHNENSWNKLKEFKNKLATHTVYYYTNDRDLAVQLAVDVSRFVHGREVKKEAMPPTATAEPQKDAILALIWTLYGDVWPHLPETLLDAGFRPEYLDTPESLKQTLTPTHLLIIPGSGYRRDRSMPESEVEVIAEFVAKGGGLLCAGQAWSWAYRQYGNKPVEEFPLNRLGREFGFRITARNIGPPDMSTLDDSLKATVKQIRRDKWAASEIEGIAPSKMPLLCDDRGRMMALLVQHGKGRVIIVGHEAMLEQNPDLLKACLDILKNNKT